MEIWNYTLYDSAYASVVAAYLLRSYGGVQFMMDALANADNDMAQASPSPRRYPPRPRGPGTPTAPRRPRAPPSLQ
jgi:hypothetical protein